MRVSYPLDRSLGTLFTGTSYAARSAPGNVLTIFIRRNTTGHMSFILDDPHGTTAGTLSLPHIGRTTTIRNLALPLHDIIWAWRQGLGMANLDLEIQAFDAQGRRLLQLETFLCAETDTADGNVRKEIARFRSANLKLVKVP